MKKRVIVAHGWEGTPEEGWFPWIKKELEANGFDVFIPQLPDPENPRIQKWVQKLAETVGSSDEDTYLVGHSMGCQTIARYLEQLPDDVVVGGAVFVAGFFKRLTGLRDDADVQETDRHWLEAPIDLKKVKTHLKKSIAIFSDDDPFVPQENQDDFKELLGSKIIVEHQGGHFSGGLDKCFELPVALDAVLEIAEDNSELGYN